MASANTNAITFISELQSFAAQLKLLLVTASDIQDRQTINNYTANFAAMQTYTLNADGTQGNTDVIPVATHPIVDVHVSSSELSGALGYGVNDFVSFMTGSGPVSQSDRRSAIGALLP